MKTKNNIGRGKTGRGKKREKAKSGGKSGGKSRKTGSFPKDLPKRAGPRRPPASQEAGRPAGRAGFPAHDTYFREVFSQEKYSLDIFRLALPKKLFNLLDWSSLKAEMQTFLDDEMRESRTDILCSVKIKKGGGRLGLLFLLEHRSHQGRDIHQILLNHQASAYRALKMPIVPIVAYSGKRPKWRLPLDFHGSLSPDFESASGQLRAAAEVWEAIKGHVLNFRYILLNLRELDLEGRARGLISHPALFIIKNIWGLKEDPGRAEKIIERLLRLGRDLSFKDWEALVKKALDYIHSFDPNFNWVFVNRIDQKVTGGKNIMFLSEPLKEEREKGLRDGLQKGRKEERREVVFNMLQKNLEIPLISEVTGMPEREICELKNGKAE